jgi:hypothetical protein
MFNNEDPLTVMNQGAVAVHELFTAYMEAGFTEDQALKIVIGLLSNVMGHSE